MGMGIIDETRAWISNTLGQYLKTKTSLIDAENNELSTANGRLEILTGDMVFGENVDDLNITFPSSTVERYLFEKDSVKVLELEVTYTDSTKTFITRVQEI